MKKVIYGFWKLINWLVSLKYIAEYWINVNSLPIYYSWYVQKYDILNLIIRMKIAEIPHQYTVGV